MNPTLTKPKPSDPTRLLTVLEVAAALRMGKRSVWRLISSGELPTVRIGRCVRVSADALRAFVERRAGR